MVRECERESERKRVTEKESHRDRESQRQRVKEKECGRVRG